MLGDLRDYEEILLKTYTYKQKNGPTTNRIKRIFFFWRIV